MKVDDTTGETTAGDTTAGDTTAGDTAAGEHLKTGNGTELVTKTAKNSYILGTTMGENFRRDELELDLDLVMQGVKDALDENIVMSPEDAKKIMQEFQKEMGEKRKARTNAAKLENLDIAKKYLEENKTKEGVVTLESGLQYKVLTAGAGDKHPEAASKVKVHYRGTLLDGTEFDSSYKRKQPATFGVGQVIKGWTEALQLMAPGAKWELYIPPGLAYGERDQRNIPANSLLIFEVELLEIL